MLYWSHTSATPSLQTGAETLRHQAVQAELMRRQFGSERMLAQLGSALQGALHGFLHQQQLELGAWLDDATETPTALVEQAAAYLLAELGAQAGQTAPHAWVLSRAAAELAAQLQQHLGRHEIALPWRDETLSWRALAAGHRMAARLLPPARGGHDAATGSGRRLAVGVAAPGAGGRAGGARGRLAGRTWARATANAHAPAQRFSAPPAAPSGRDGARFPNNCSSCVSAWCRKKRRACNWASSRPSLCPASCATA
ncbi:hypothetical protein LP419_38425 [Massilia sp. H-1]|nr:hypothetical protein LP419_38425 [Massilia sp. H-1]